MLAKVGTRGARLGLGTPYWPGHARNPVGHPPGYHPAIRGRTSPAHHVEDQTDLAGAGDHVLVAPSFIVSENELGELVDKLGRAITRALA
jgi:hypothetical protein